MNDFISVIKSCFGFLESTEIFGISILYWLIAAVLISAIMRFIIGTKGGD